MNREISNDDELFALPPKIYYRIYADRERVFEDLENHRLLAKAGFCQFYAPYLYWICNLPVNEITKIISLMRNELLFQSKKTGLYHIVRLAVLIGGEAVNWLEKLMQEAWGKHPQPPDFVFKFKEMKAKASSRDSRYLVIGKGEDSSLEINNASYQIKVLLEDPDLSKSLLSQACTLVARNENGNTTLCRTLDLIAYGKAIQDKSDEIVSTLFDAK